AVALLREKEGRLCVRLHRRPDGTVMTADCPRGRPGLLRRLGRRLAAAAAALPTLGLLSGCVQEGGQGDAVRGVAREPGAEPRPFIVMGKIMCPEDRPPQANPAPPEGMP